MTDIAKRAMSERNMAFYEENGYLHVKRLISREEAADLRQEAHDLAARLMAAHHSGVVGQGWTSGSEITDLPRELLHCHNVQFHSAAFTRLIVDPRFTDVAAGIIGPNVQLHHTKMFIKPPEKGAPFPLHQDYPYFPHERNSMIAAIIHFDDAPLEKGCVRVVPGSFKRGPLNHIPEGGWHLPVSDYPLESSVALPAEAGDALFFSYLTIHGSGLNVSREARTTLLVQMRDPEDRPVPITHVSRGQGMMLRGVDPSADAGPNVDSASKFEREQRAKTSQ